jgi:chromosome segregation ATPase
LDTERAALDTTRTQLEAEKREALELADKLSAELEALQGRVATVEASEQAARRELEATRTQLGAMNERAVIAEVRAIEIERRADDLSAELARLNGHNATLAKALVARAQRRGPSKQERRQ